MRLNQVYTFYQMYRKCTFRGSTPGDRIKNTGVLSFVSSYDFSKDCIRNCMNFSPNFSSTKYLCLLEHYRIKRIRRK